MSFLDGAFAIERDTAGPAAGAPAVAGPQPVQAPDAPPASGSGDDVSASAQAQLVGLGLVVVGVLVAVVMKETKPPFAAADGFVLLTGFYVAAQAIERLLELLPSGRGSKQAKANRAVIFPSIGFVIAVVAAESVGLYYMQALGAADVSRDLDVIVTALAIGGGTKPLHDGIKRIEKAKETPPATT